MNIDISESNYKALVELAKNIPTELLVRESESGKSIVVECRHGNLMSGNLGQASAIIAIIQAAKIIREISYNAQIHRLQQERDGLV